MDDSQRNRWDLKGGLSVDGCFKHSQTFLTFTLSVYFKLLDIELNFEFIFTNKRG